MFFVCVFFIFFFEWLGPFLPFFLVKSCDPVSWMLILLLYLPSLKFTILQFCGMLGKTVLLLLPCFLYIFIANLVRKEILWVFLFYFKAPYYVS